MKISEGSYVLDSAGNSADLLEGVVPELSTDEEQGGGGVHQGVWVDTRHDGQHCLVAGHVGPAIKCPVRQGQLEEEYKQYHGTNYSHPLSYVTSFYL